jgi:hypothetical protein
MIDDRSHISVVVCVHNVPYKQPTTERSGHASGQLSAQKSAPPGEGLRDFPHRQHAALLERGRSYDPYKVHREFPARWQAYIRANYRSIAHVTQVFEVSERTARKWWAGETGAVGGHVAIAVNEHPDTAPAFLFAAE